MKRRLLLTLIFSALVLPVSASDAGDKIQLTAAQITKLLSGNTISGSWSGSSYKQFFATGGMTMYIPDGGRADQGRWRTNAETNSYESWWQMTNWTSYTVMMTNDGYAWANGDVLETFEVLKGKQISW